MSSDMMESGNEFEEKERAQSPGAVVNYELTTMSTNNNNNINNNDDGALLHPDVGSKRDRELFEMAEKLYALRNEPAYL